MTTWNLTPFYEAFDSLRFTEDMAALETRLTTFESWRPDSQNPIGSCRDYLALTEAIALLQDRLLHFCELTYTADTSHPEAQKYLQRLEETGARTTAAEIGFISFLGGLESLAPLFEAAPDLEPHRFVLEELQQQARHRLSPQEELLAARLKSCGSSAWELLHSQITAELTLPFEDQEGPRQLTLSEVRALASSPSPFVRKKAYEAERAAYPAIASQAAFALNAIKGEVLTLSQLRGYPSPLAEALTHSRLRPESLQAMLSAIRNRLPVLHRYLRHKAALLGHPGGLPFYDLFAPLGEAGRSFTLEEAEAMILRLFGGFSKDLGAFAKQAFESRWVDWLPRKGKVGGAFCSYCHPLKESRILLNFTGTLDDITTLAHELGHGYHNAQLTGESIHNIDYPMPLAEAASIFCETLVVHGLMQDLPQAERAGILELRLQMITQVLADIYSRYLFEERVFEHRAQYTLSAEELSRLMLTCQQEAYGDGMAADCLHPEMWICKPHYYSGSLSYYNFPYAFGLLFATGLYSRYRRDPEHFAADYRKLLSLTGKQPVEAVAAAAGMDITTEAFWEEALDVIAEEVNAFIPS